ncbi:MAG: hypothetical protein ABJA57_10605 [Ginsengibacter sp.]
MSSMEPDVRNFLLKIITSISVGLLWLLINSTIGIGLNYAFFEERPRLLNYIFYAWFLGSLLWLLLYLRRKWKS